MRGRLYYHPTCPGDKGAESIDNVNNLHSGLRLALSSLKDACNLTDGIEWSNLPWNKKKWSVRMKFAVAYFIGDTPQHDQLCGHYQTSNSKMICRHCNCPRALGINARVNVLKVPVSLKSGNMQVSKHQNGDEYQSIRLWNISDFTAPTVDEGVNVEQYFKNISHHGVHNGNAFYDLDFGENPHNIHLASPGERLHMHQLGCAKRAAETFREDFLGNNQRLLGEMERLASYYGGAVQRQSDRDFPRTNFSESIHTAKKEGNQYIGMLYIQMLSLLSAGGRQLLLSRKTPSNLENKSRKCEEEIDRRIYAIELLLGMEEFLKYAGTFDEVFKQDKKGVLNVDKMVVLFINCINNNLQRSKGEGNNLVKNHMYFHLSQYMRLFGPPTGWDSAASESNHKTEVKAPAKRTQQNKSTLIKQTCNRVMEYRTIDRLDREFDLFEHRPVTGPNHPKEGGWSAGPSFWIGVMNGLPYMKWDEKKNSSLPWFPSDVLKFCCDVVLPAVGSSKVFGTTEHKRYDKSREMKLLFRAHPSFKSDSGQLSNVWNNWANFQLGLLDGRGLQVYPCQILCLLYLEGPFPVGSSVSGFELVHDGYYAVARCFVSADPIPSKRDKGKKHHHALVKLGELRNKLYLFDCNAIESEAAVVRNHGSPDQYFVLGNREQWLFNFRETMASLEKKDLQSIVRDGENST